MRAHLEENPFGQDLRRATEPLVNRMPMAAKIARVKWNFTKRKKGIRREETAVESIHTKRILLI